jgi:hypothetical protein
MVDIFITYLLQYRQAINAGVSTKVTIVAMAKPKEMQVANCTHHCVDGAPRETSLATKLIFNCNTMGRRPKIVVTVVNNIGRNLCTPVMIIASNTDTSSLFR